MPVIQVHILNGPHAGKRLAFSDPIVRFGREADGQIVLANPFVSRRHGELRLEGQGWVLVNQSPNGTKVGSRRAGAKPLPLRDGDTVCIGEDAVFRVSFEPIAAPAPEAETPAEAAPAKKPRKRQTLWIGIGVYLLVMLGLFVFLSTLADSGGGNQRKTSEWSAAQIDEALRTLPQGLPRDERRGQDLLSKANRLTQTDPRPQALFQAYRAYQQALAHLGQDQFESGADQQRYKDAQQRLIGRVTDLYRDACVNMLAGHYAEAVKKFESLQRLYDDPNSDLYRNISQHLAYCKPRAGKKRL